MPWWYDQQPRSTRVPSRYHSVSHPLRRHAQANGARLVVLATFDASDRGRERGTRVDFTGTHAAESRQAFQATLIRFLAR